MQTEYFVLNLEAHCRMTVVCKLIRLIQCTSSQARGRVSLPSRVAPVAPVAPLATLSRHCFYVFVKKTADTPCMYRGRGRIVMVHTYKIVLCGAKGVGKSSIFFRIRNRTFDSNIIAQKCTQVQECFVPLTENNTNIKVRRGTV